MSRAPEYALRLFLAWLNDRYRRSFAFEGREGDLWRASDPAAGSLVAVCSELFEADDRWRARCAELEARLDETRPGSYLLWQPPGADLPEGEPYESEWVRRVVLAASKLASGRSGEARLPVVMALGKVRDEGGYASVTGGLGRFWTEISNRLQGSFYLDSRGLHRFTKNEQERRQLYEHIALLSQGLETGQVVEFEHEDAWALQRLPRGPAAARLTDGWAITGCPPGFSPDDGGAVRRILRRRLAEAGEALRGARDAARALVLIGAYEYMEMENTGPSLRGFDPALAAPFDAIALVSDAEVKALRLSRALPFVAEGART
ncbi:MAG TPA: hypothetical protein VNN21_06105 [Dehalococcoidia bacterium]|nr:hypothetical protein [Dehalococcoidia bacterium]